MIPGEYSKEDIKVLIRILTENDRLPLALKIEEQLIGDSPMEPLVGWYVNFIIYRKFSDMPMLLSTVSFRHFAKWRLEIGK